MGETTGDGTPRRVRVRLRMHAGETLRWGERVSLEDEGGITASDVGVDVATDVGSTDPVEGHLLFWDDASAERFIAVGVVAVMAGDDNEAVACATALEGIDARADRWVEGLVDLYEKAIENGQEASTLAVRVEGELMARRHRGRGDASPDDVAVGALLAVIGPTRWRDGASGNKAAAAAVLFGLKGVGAFAEVEPDRGVHPDPRFVGMVHAAVRSGVATLSPAPHERDPRAMTLRRSVGERQTVDNGPIGPVRGAELGQVVARAGEVGLRYASVLARWGEARARTEMDWVSGADRAEAGRLLAAFGLRAGVGQAVGA